MSEAFDQDDRLIASVEVDYRAGDRLQMKLVDWPTWLVAPACAVGAMLVVSLFFRLNAGQSFWDALSMLPFGLAGLLGLCFLIVKITYELVPLAWEHFSGGASEPEPQGTFGLQEDGLAIRSKSMIATISWPMFESFRSTPDRLFYFLSARSIFVLPRRCFADDEMYDRWRQFSERKVLQDREE